MNRTISESMIKYETKWWCGIIKSFSKDWEKDHLGLESLKANFLLLESLYNQSSNDWMTDIYY